ncbi:MAG: hypothetical protein V2A71_02765 [Candidatus Eisenbacteria bacterium]
MTEVIVVLSTGPSKEVMDEEMVAARDDGGMSIRGVRGAYVVKSVRPRHGKQL